jgi:hypothetical protein
MSSPLPAGPVLGHKAHGLGQRTQTSGGFTEIAGAMRRLFAVHCVRLAGGRRFMRPFEHIAGHIEQPPQKLFSIVIHDVYTVTPGHLSVQ